jgi:hypothetical protein
MNEATGVQAPRSFWVISVVALVWNLLGLAAYVAQVTMTPDALAALPPDERALYENVPVWATSAYALAVNGGVLGCLLLLLRKSWAIPFLVVSLISVLVQMFHAFFLTNALAVYGPGITVMPSLVTAVAIFLVWYAVNAKNKGWIT